MEVLKNIIKNEIVKIDKCPKCGKDCNWIKVPFAHKDLIVPDCKCRIEERKIDNQDRKIDYNKILIEKYLKQSGIALNKLTLNTFLYSDNEKDKEHQKRVIAKIKDYIINYKDKYNTSLIALWGNIGTGKTELSKIIGKELIKRYRIRVRYITPVRLNFELRYGITELGMNSIETNKYYYDKLNMIIINEFGTGNSWEQEVVYDLIDYYYDNNKSLIINTNRYLSKEENNIYAKFWDRIKDKNKNNISLPCIWSSLRR